MNINYDLLLDNLRKVFYVSCYGTPPDVPLSRPSFYKEGSPMESGHAYIVTPDNLPPFNYLESNAVLICVGGLPSLSYQYSGQSILVVMGNSLRDVFNEVLNIYDRYQSWSSSLDKVLTSGADIQKMLELTAPLLMNDLTVIDENLRIIAAVSFQKMEDGSAMVVKKAKDVMPVSYVEKYKKSIHEFRNKKSPYFADEGCYCINLFLGDTLLGNLSLFPMINEINNSDIYVVDELAGFIQTALQMQTDTKSWEHDQFESVIHKILDNEFVEEELLDIYTGDPEIFPEGRFICLYVQTAETTGNVTLDYVQALLMENYSNIAMIHIGDENIIVKDFAGTSMPYEDFVDSASKDLDRLGLQAGASNCFQRLTKLRFHINQAQNALRFARQSGKSDSLVLFRDYALQYLLFNSPGIFPAEYVCPQSLLKLREYDSGSNVDYWKTLRTYLDNQMNIADTARALGIHRNTLIQRIERIDDILEKDLNDPMFRLWLRVSIYLFDYELA